MAKPHASCKNIPSWGLASQEPYTRASYDLWNHPALARKFSTPRPPSQLSLVADPRPWLRLGRVTWQPKPPQTALRWAQPSQGVQPWCRASCPGPGNSPPAATGGTARPPPGSPVQLFWLQRSVPNMLANQKPKNRQPHPPSQKDLTKHQQKGPHARSGASGSWRETNTPRDPSEVGDGTFPSRRLLPVQPKQGTAAQGWAAPSSRCQDASSTAWRFFKCSFKQKVNFLVQVTRLVEDRQLSAPTRSPQTLGVSCAVVLGLRPRGLLPPRRSCPSTSDRDKAGPGLQPEALQLLAWADASI